MDAPEVSPARRRDTARSRRRIKIPTSWTRPRPRLLGGGTPPHVMDAPAAPPATRRDTAPRHGRAPRPLLSGGGTPPHVMDAPAARPARRRDTAPRHGRARGPSCQEAGHRPTSWTRPRPVLPGGGTPPHVMDAPDAPPARRRDTAPRHGRARGPSCQEAGHRPTSWTRRTPLLPGGGTPPHVMDAPAARPARRRDTAPRHGRAGRPSCQEAGHRPQPPRSHHRSWRCSRPCACCAPAPRGGAPSSPARARVRP